MINEIFTQKVIHPIKREWHNTTLTDLRSGPFYQNEPAAALLMRDLPGVLRMGMPYQDLTARMGAPLGSFLFQERGYDPSTVYTLAETGIFSDLFAKFVLRYPGAANLKDMDSMAKIVALNSEQYAREYPYTYHPTRRENGKVHRAIVTSETTEVSAERKRARNSASTVFSLQGLNTERIWDQMPEMLEQEVGIIGGGVFGLMAARALHEMGMVYQIYERSQTGGIWTDVQKTGVWMRSKNNPGDLEFEGFEGQKAVVTKAKDIRAGSGIDIRAFAYTLQDGFSDYLEDPIQAEVVGINTPTPNRPNFQVVTQPVGSMPIVLREYPFIISALGLGRPTELDNPKRIQTDLRGEQLGKRWQQNLENLPYHEKRAIAEKLSNGPVILIGLGNSTLEMAHQFYKLMDEFDIDIDFTIVTDYPEQSVVNPEKTVKKNGKDHRVARQLDPKKFNVEGTAYDLPAIAKAYDRALHEGKFLTDVKSITKLFQTYADGTSQYGLQVKNNKDSFEFWDMVDLYTLIGYAPDKDVLRRFNVPTADKGMISVDYTGMIPEYPGYYAIGNGVDRENAATIPGGFDQLYLLLFDLLIRSAEKSMHK